MEEEEYFVVFYLLEVWLIEKLVFGKTSHPYKMIAGPYCSGIYG